MSEAVSNPLFPLFTFLPPELRIEIWRYALSEDDPPALCPYQRDCWCPGSPHLGTVEVELRPELLDHVRVKIPIASVNQEARETAIDWVPKKGIKVSFHSDRQCLIFIRPFDPARDILYIPSNMVENFDRQFWGGSDSDDVVSIPPVFHFAVAEQLFQEDTTELLRNIIFCFAVSADLFVIADPQPEFGDAMSPKVQPRWELEGTDGEVAFFFNKRTNNMEAKVGRHLHDKTFQRVHDMIGVVDEAIKGSLDLVFPHFEIRLVGAVRR